MNLDAKNLDKILSNWIQQCLKTKKLNLVLKEEIKWSLFSDNIIVSFQIILLSMSVENPKEFTKKEIT